MKTTTLRKISLVFMTVFAAWLGLRHQYPELSFGMDSGPIDKYCPFGGLETFLSYVSTGSYLAKTGFSNFVLLAATLILAVITGASFCGWLCPLGAIQDFLSGIGKKIFGQNYQFPKKVHEKFRYLRFVLLAFIIYLSYQTGKLVFADYDPYKIFFHFRFETYTALVIFVVFTILSTLIERFWCKYLCPFGAIFSLIAPVSLFKIKRQKAGCINCKKCSKVCPMDIDIENSNFISETECIKCMNCIDVCPVSDTLNLTFGKQADPTGGATYEG